MRGPTSSFSLVSLGDILHEFRERGKVIEWGRLPIRIGLVEDMKRREVLPRDACVISWTG
jgi:hypothetical protein